MPEPTVNEVLTSLETAVRKLNDDGGPFEPAHVLRLIAAHRLPAYVPRQRANNHLEEADHA